MEVIRVTLQQVAIAGYLLIIWQLWRTRLWLRYPLFGLMLLMDAASVGIVGHYDKTWIARIEYAETTLKLFVAWEAFRRVTEFVGPILKGHLWMMLVMVVLVGALLTVGLYNPGDPLHDVKEFRQYVHTGLAVAGWALVLFFVLYRADVDRRDGWHGVLLVIWWTAVAVAMLTKPGPGEMVKWQVANIGYRVTVIGCLIGWQRLFRQARALGK